MSDANPFAKLVPGFDFLQSLTKTATQAAMPGGAFGNWIAPTLDPDELDKRISELRTVQYWLEQNAKMLAATIQALEVQRMTLATLKSMNMPLTDLTKMAPRPAASTRPRVATPPPAPLSPARAPSFASAPAPAPAPAPVSAPEAASERGAAAPAADAKPETAAVDAMKWWGALTQQFSDIASQVVNDSVARATGRARSARAAAKAGPPAAGQAAPAKPKARPRRASPRKA